MDTQAVSLPVLNPLHQTFMLTSISGRWLFIIDGIITLPLAVMGYFFFPNLPQDGKRTWWTTQREHEISVERMNAVGRAGKQPWTKEKAKKIALSWHTWLLRKLA